MVANYFQSKRAHSVHKYERRGLRNLSKEFQREYEIYETKDRNKSVNIIVTIM
jgi:hypothetical protein